MQTPPEPNPDRLGSRELQKIVDDFVDKGKKQEVLTARQELVKKANAVTMKVQQTFLSKHPYLNLVPVKKDDARDEIYSLYRDNYTTWTRDELLENLALIQACYHAESMHDHLI